MVKRNAIVAVLAFVVLWPIGQRLAVARWDLDPWKFSGFAMYATPSLPVLMLAFAPGPNGLAAIDETSLPAWTRERLDRFRTERLALGPVLRDPKDAGQALLIARPDLPQVVLLVQRTVLDSTTATIAASTERYVYDRPGG